MECRVNIVEVPAGCHKLAEPGYFSAKFEDFDVVFYLC
jgi:hypothetical protein